MKTGLELKTLVKLYPVAVGCVVKIRSRSASMLGNVYTVCKRYVLLFVAEGPLLKNEKRQVICKIMKGVKVLINVKERFVDTFSESFQNVSEYTMNMYQKLHSGAIHMGQNNPSPSVFLR